MGKETNTHRRFPFRLQSYRLHQIEQDLTGHILYPDRQGVVMDIAREQLDGQREVREGEVASDMVDQVYQDAISHGAHCLSCGPARPD